MLRIMKHYSIVFSLLNILTLFVSCVRAGRFSTDLDQEFQKAADQERALSAQCLESRRLYGNLKYGMDQQNSSIITNNTVGHLIKRIDSETHGSPVRLRTLLLRELRENGRLSFLQELNRYYRVLDTNEFTSVASQSGKEPSSLYSY